ncbi:pentapeptide repeat-containing protein [Microcoleus sp. herbarium2]|uniref:pentapeptide repeat-containing protein n=1 Tax=Microcoleus sp. herbarium2 TaxID=3055433 RepID=UPI0040409BAE
MVEAEFIQPNFKDTQLRGSDFSGCRVKGACFTDPQKLTCQHKQWLKANEP